PISCHTATALPALPSDSAHLSLEICIFLFPPPPDHPALHSFPTRRSSDLSGGWIYGPRLNDDIGRSKNGANGRRIDSSGTNSPKDRKSTRLNSSHVSISYAVFCLKKKTNTR